MLILLKLLLADAVLVTLLAMVLLLLELLLADAVLVALLLAMLLPLLRGRQIIKD